MSDNNLDASLQALCIDSDQVTLDPSVPETIPKFIDPLPIPKTAEPDKSSYSDNSKYYHIVMMEAKHRFHSLFPPTTVWGYNGTYPGPTIVVPKDIPVKVKWENKLPKKHLFPVDHTLHGTMDTPDVRTVVHLHGANVASDSDGHPDAWYSRDNVFVGHKYSREEYEYTNHQAGATLWYHDHAIGITRLNVYAGLAGFYLIRDHLEKRLGLPEGPYEINLPFLSKHLKYRVYFKILLLQGIKHIENLSWKFFFIVFYFV